MANLSFSNLKKTLVELEFEKVDTISQIKSYAIRGDTISIWLPLCENPYLFTFFGEDLESVKEFETKKVEANTSTYQSFTRSQISANKDNLLTQVVNQSTWAEVLIFLQNQIHEDDYVVHEDHGVAKYIGLIKNNDRDYLLLQYAGEDKLYIPLSQISKITKYIGASENPPKVTRLNGGEWNRIRNKVKESVVLIAKDLLMKMALREVSNAPEINEPTSLFNDFCNDFPFELTIDQQKATDEIIRDLVNSRQVSQKDRIIRLKPMNRLLVADVGFGKTEVAARTSFLVAESGYQVAILCPTTILAIQHYKLFKNRFEKFGLKVAHLSSFNTKSTNFEIIRHLSENKIDVTIGTHRLLQNDVKIPNLGLLIIDEEQKFGVKQKEKIKSLRFGVHVLSMSATPIPRTLSLALSKLQDISVMTTPPKGRKAVITESFKTDWNKIREIILYETKRDGQIYFVHNEVKTILSIKNKLAQLIPEIKICVAYSKSLFDKKNNSSLIGNNEENSNLEKVISDFYERKYDVLLTTTIIENGIDMPNVNTIIIHKAQNFGLSQLHQLRGRVGRSEVQGYCYLSYDEKVTNQKAKEVENNLDNAPKIKEKKKIEKYKSRINTLVSESSLGAGFNIASRDLEIRGSGNILGKEQSGNINLVGYGMYIKLLEEEIKNIQQ